MKPATPLLVRLENYYRECGILSTDFRCRHECKCRGGLSVTPESATTQKEIVGSFTQAKSAFVGIRYGVGIPRLLFVSSDPGAAIYNRADGDSVSFAPAKSRTPSGVQNREATTEYDLEISNHWKWTHKLTCAILNLRLPALEDATPYFANLNAAKCTVNNAGNREAAALFKNCRDYMPGEIEILAPNIIVAQGNKAQDGVRKFFRNKKAEKNCLNAWTVSLENGREIFWWHTAHPSSFGRPKFDRQMEGRDGGPGLDGYIRMIHEFIRKRDDRCLPE